MPSWIEAFMDVKGWQLTVVATAAVSGALVYWVLSRALRLWARRTDTPADDHILQRLRPPGRLLGPLAAITLSWPFESTPPFSGLRHVLVVLSIFCSGWLLASMVRALEEAAGHHFEAEGSSEALHARSLRTRLRGFANAGIFLVVVATLAAALITFEGVRQLGVSLFASAGVAGIIMGFAAQRSIATLVAGIQIALTQPIRVDDVVIVEGEWGSIEEITLTYVVVRIWDDRRLVVPISRFIEQPFQNWTRKSKELLGTVFLYADYTVPVDAVRQELTRVCESASQWDGRVCGLVVTDSKPQVLELRALVSAADAGKLWELRCHVREALVDYLQRAHPQCLPRIRGELSPELTKAG